MFQKAGFILRKLWYGLRLRCPNCEQGLISNGLLSIEETCPVCHVRFERQPGESTGAMMITLSLLPILALGLFFVLYSTMDLPVIVLLAVLIGFIVIAGVFFYRHTRGLWIGVIYLTAGLHPDPEDPAEH